MHTILTFWLFQLSEEGFFYFFLLRWFVADTHHNVIHDDLPSNPDPKALNWLIALPKAETAAPSSLSHIKATPSCSDFPENV